MRDNPNQQLAHIATFFSFNDCFKQLPSLTSPGQLCKPLVGDVNVVDPDSLVTPLHLAVKSSRLATVQAVLAMNPKLELCDKNGNNCLHYAATTSREIIAAICSSILAANNNIPNGDQGDGNAISATFASNGHNGSSSRDEPNRELLNLINAKNREQATPIHLACLEDKPDCVKELLKNGAHVNGACIETRNSTSVSGHPSHQSSQNSSFDSSPDNLEKWVRSIFYHLNNTLYSLLFM